MLQQLARLMLAVAVWTLSTGVAHAVSLGKIEVASGLGEPFYAEIPLSVDEGENLQSVKVSIASGSDYRILEVYRDSALNQIRTNVESDSRGTRVELNSFNPIDAPFFNLVLRVQYDRATQFKKFPIFLDLPKAAKAPATAKPVPTVKAVEGMAPAESTTAPAMAMPQMSTEPAAGQAAAAAPVQEAPTATHAFHPFDSWARIGRYGPMVYGDTISTVAKRLRVDDRFTQQQVMVALFEKNREKFDQDNINLIKAGTYLDVPSAAEVSRISSAQARSVIAEHEKRWKELTKQPRYAAVEEAQRTRYSKRIRIGEQASGTAAAPMSTEGEQGKSTGAGSESSAAAGMAPASGQSTAAVSAEAEKAKAEVEQLTRQNQALQAKLAESDKKLQDLAGKLSEEGQAAQERTRKKLELQVARLQAELDRARDQAKVAESSAGPGWLTWVLGGLVVVLLGAIGFLIRREPKHPAAMTDAEPAIAPDHYAQEESYTGYESPEEEEVPEIEVEEADVEAATGDFSDFDDSDFGDSTMRISPDEAAEFSNSIPDLTDEDTSEMEAFQEEVEEEPDPNVDYLSEADVYLRYGMEDEALQQVNMALKQDPHNPEAYIKLAQIQKQKGDDQAVNEAVAAASGALSGDALETFNAAVAELQAGEADASSLEDTMPPTEASEMIGSDADQSAEEGDFDLGDGLDMGGLDFEDVGGASEEEMPEADATVVEAPTFESSEPVEGEAEAAAEAAADDLSFDLSGMDIGEEASDETQEEAPDAAVSSGGGLDFDLSDVDVPESAKPAATVDEPEVATADLDSTVAIDWSQDTSVDSGEQQISGESGAADMFEEAPAAEEEAVAEPSAGVAEEGLDADMGGLDFDLSALEEDTAAETESAEAEEAAAEPEVPAADEGEGVTTLDLDAGDLDAGMDLSEIEVEPADDFTSTITSTVTDVSSSDVDFTATGEHDLQKTGEAISSGDDAGSGSDDDDLLNLDFDADDQDATQQLEDLLSEFSDEDEDKKDQ